MAFADIICLDQIANKKNMIPFRLAFLTCTTFYQVIASLMENRKSPPGQLINIDGYNLHYYIMGEGSPTVILDHSLGGIEGYLLIQEIAKLTRVCIYDRSGYGWSDINPHPRNSEQIILEMNSFLTKAKIDPPYILVGNSFGSYNVRLYAHRYPEKVVGMILTDALHEVGMLKMPLLVKGLKLFFMSGFLMSILGSTLGIIRLLRKVGFFELIKPKLRKLDNSSLNLIKQSFCRPKHWLTMFREMVNLNKSGYQLQNANNFKTLPIVLITAKSFFKPSLFTFILPIKTIDKLRKKMHHKIMNLSNNCIQLQADKSSHFVWIDQPEIIVKAIKIIISKLI